MKSFEVIGSKKLKGDLIPQGAKNEALQVICAVLLTPETIVIRNIPDILDVRLLIGILEELGVETNKIDENTYSFKAENIHLEKLDDPAFQQKANRLRGSVMIAGPLLARFGKSFIPKPGGDKIGRRKMDTHIDGFLKLGVKWEYDPALGYFKLSGKEMIGTDMLLDEPSVTGTANIVMAAVMAKGTTTIYNAACEPYLQQLCQMLNRMGAKISGIKSNLLTIEGVASLKGTDHKILPDMIEVGSFIGLAAMTGSALNIRGAGVEHLGMIPDKFRQLGIAFDIVGDDILVPEQDGYEIRDNIDGSVLTIYDHPWPGLTPDLLSIILVIATQAKGSVLIHQKMFESRLFFVDKLIDMGARIILCDPHRATVIGQEGKQRLRGITMSSPDIRAGVALLIAALSAEGKSIIHNIEQIDRGYQYLDKRLTALGASIKRIEA
jgi:UDP-N-acetylglucosamine 1-carboxyvinyltransferase